MIVKVSTPDAMLFTVKVHEREEDESPERTMQVFVPEESIDCAPIE